MKYIVTGATSFIGVELCSYLLSVGHEVYAVCRKGSSKTKILPQDSHLHFLHADMVDYGNLHRQINHADVFVNLAWDATSHEGRDMKEAQWQNVENSIEGMVAARRMGCVLFVEAGSQAEYGLTNKAQTPDSPCHPFSEYGKAKLTIKNMAFAYAKLTGMKCIHLRIFSTFGENDKSWTLISMCISKMLRNEPIDLSPCTQNWNFIYVKDAAKQIALLCDYAMSSEDFTQEIFHIASDDTRPLRDFVLEIKQITCSRSQLNFGAKKPERLVSLQPDIEKTKTVIDFVSKYSFTDGINQIIKKQIKND